MTVVSNTSPITNLAAIDQLHLLREIYGTILIPQAVYDELTVFDRPVPGTAEVQMFDWINVRRVTDRNQVANLRQVVDAGEAEAIALALELSAERLLIDEASGRALAESLGLSITGILGTLLIAKQRGLVLSIQPLMEDLIQKAGFWVSPGLYRLVLDSAGELFCFESYRNRRTCPPVSIVFRCDRSMPIASLLRPMCNSHCTKWPRWSRRSGIV